MKKLLSIALLSLPIVACTTNTVTKNAPPAPTGDGNPAQTPGSATATVTAAEGGVVEADGIRLEVPAGAVDEDTAITITKVDDAPPARHAAVSALYKFEPDALKFKKAAKIIYTAIPADTFMPVIGIAKDADNYDGQTTKVADGMVYASISTLSSSFVAKTECMQSDGNATTPCHPVPPPATVKSGIAINGFAITGFEYWQWKKPDPYAGGDEVAWGYNGDGEPKTGVMPTDVSRACMAEAVRTLTAILTNDPPQELKDLKDATGVSQFWFWNNDMTDAKTSVKVPKQDSELWLYDGSRSDHGLIKWISETERDGTCHLPTREDLVTFAKACKTAFPNCLSGK